MAPSSAIKRIVSISRAEVLLFVRNPTILLTALLLPVVMVAWMLAPSLGLVMEGATFASFIVQTLAVWALLLIVYVNLTTIFVSRREDGVFQRMSTGEASPWEDDCGERAVGGGDAGAGHAGRCGCSCTDGGIGGQSAAHPRGCPGAGVPRGISAWTSRYTSTVEGAQFSTMPILMVLLFTSGSLIPVSVLPETLARLSEWTPFYAVNELIGIGMTGVSGIGVDAGFGDGGVLVTGSFVELDDGGAAARSPRDLGSARGGDCAPDNAFRSTPMRDRALYVV